MGGEFDLLVPPLRRAIHAGDQGGAMHLGEVAEAERVAGLGLVAGPFGQAEVPPAVVVP